MKNADSIKHFLIKRIFSQLGAGFGRAVCDSANKSGVISVTEVDAQGNDVERSLPIWKGMLTSEMVYKCMITDFGTDKEPEHVVIIAGFSPLNFENPEAVYGLHFLWDDQDPGRWFMRAEDVWAPMPLQSCLLLGSFVEGATSSGMLWGPCLDPDGQLTDWLRKFITYI